MTSTPGPSRDDDPGSSCDRAKQTPGWHLDQPEPGMLTWTLPSGRRYTTAPEPYPA